ncbi:HtpX-like protease [Actinoplanes sp. SE50]|uniref:hypothetical protein n=1 Tax=unclassified Actinoplanes TaxID=2626549 RepID=UPI00023ED4B1|nr:MULTISPECIES: hypothetical protein [unclassified Actinoplanes]AEV86735.1 hypothetical protein ACPL_5848 [Actinoplanes sp. SE50/110]ATO85132.1 HtpX-like protease [Actinoplanes sp. SE50]SLM02543.1 hypothetical protein ACSP50_5793 [Actinoplanes sp. SE50/110]
MSNQQPPAINRDLVTTLTAAALAAAAPEELTILNEIAEEYFADPDAVLNPRRRDEAVGFGVDLALLAPYALAIATPVVHFLIETASSEMQNAARPLVAQTVRRLLRRSAGEMDAPSATPLNSQQARRVREIAYDRARQLDLPEAQCVVLADAIAGAILVSA